MKVMVCGDEKGCRWDQSELRWEGKNGGWRSWFDFQLTWTEGARKSKVEQVRCLQLIKRT
jgi:hypothetical protein